MSGKMDNRTKIGLYKASMSSTVQYGADTYDFVKMRRYHELLRVTLSNRSEKIRSYTEYRNENTRTRSKHVKISTAGRVHRTENSKTKTHFDVILTCKM